MKPAQAEASPKKGSEPMATILIIDADDDFANASRGVLEKAGHTVVTAASPTEGDLALQKHNPQLLILDGMTESPDEGIVMAQALRRAGNKIPILMLTSLPKVAGMSFAKDAEMIPVDEFVEKPVSPQRLLELVSQLLSQKG
jgi:DNA-binding response OmpR family regulator